MAFYKIIEGTFHVKGYAPDGDSIRFRAKNQANWNFLNFPSAAGKKRLFHQLRVEAIDSLETHYEGVRQPNAFALAALERMLELIGITDLQYNLMFSTVVSANDGAPGFIATAGFDRYERPISFVFPHGVGLTDGAEMEAENLPVEHSVNFALAHEAIVYPTFYTTMEPVVIQKFREVFRTAKIQRQGLWAIDRTGGFRLTHPEVVQKDVILMPKIFRRFISFFEARASISDFGTYYKTSWDDKIEVHGEVKRLRDFVEWDAKKQFFKLTVSPEDMIFLPE